MSATWTPRRNPEVPPAPGVSRRLMPRGIRPASRCRRPGLCVRRSRTARTPGRHGFFGLPLFPGIVPLKLLGPGARGPYSNRAGHMPEAPQARGQAERLRHSPVSIVAFNPFHLP